MPDRALNILLVEDDEVDVMNVERAFERNKLRNTLFVAGNGLEALELLRGEKIPKERRLILLDLNMPGLDGRKTLQLIKQDGTLKRIPVIILTTSSDERDIQDCYQMGANTYVQKPVSFDGLIEAIKRLKAYWFEIALLPKDIARD